MSRVVLTASVEVAGQPAELWPQLTDTERMNRTLGMREVRYEPIEPPTTGGAATAARFLAHTRLGGLPVTYEEEPFEFVVPERYSVRRRLRGGLFSELLTRLELSPAGIPSSGGAEHTRVTCTLELLPRVGLLTPILRRSLQQSLDGMLAAAEEASRRLAGKGGPVVPPPIVDRHHLDRALETLRESGVGVPLVRRLQELVLTAHEADLVAVRPFELAALWETEPRELLRALLHSVKAGLFELRWSLVCPSCRTFTEQLRGLDEVPPEGHCQLCDISFELDVDRAVEATFVVHPGVRKVNDATFCIGGPGRTPHVLGQVNVPSGATGTFVAPTGNDRYRLFARGGAAVRLVIDAEGAPSARVTAGESHFDREEVRVVPGARLEVVNESGSPRHVKLERLVYASQAATASVLATMEDFRRLFSADLLKRGTPLKVARVAMFFSDLTGSTALYSKVGDAVAFRMVDDHFDLLRAVVAAHEGVIVKTMGDAVMAAFHEERTCVAAAVESLRRFEAFRAEREHGDAVGLKLGMYAGPCYVVTANGVLDYFGQTVNVTSRIQHLAGSGELVLETRQLESLPEADRAKVVEMERFEAQVKGVDASLHLVRVRLTATT
jgi:adenylate cyclase